MEYKQYMCLVIVIICIYHFLRLDFYLFVLSFCILREVVKFAVHIQNTHSPLGATGRPGSLWQRLAQC